MRIPSFKGVFFDVAHTGEQTTVHDQLGSAAEPAVSPSEAVRYTPQTENGLTKLGSAWCKHQTFASVGSQAGV